MTDVTTPHEEPHFCTYCAAPLQPGAPYCAACGRAVPVHLVHSASSTPQAQPCRFCGAPTEPEDRFCPVCGHELLRRVPTARVEAVASPQPDDGLPRRIAVIAIVVALLCGGVLGLFATGLFDDSSTPRASASPSSVIILSPLPTLEVATSEPSPSPVPSESPSPIAFESPSPGAGASAPTFDPFASPSAGFPGESPGLGSPSFPLGSPSPPLATPTPFPAARTIVINQTKTDPPARGNFKVTFQRIEVLADGTMQLVFHVKNVGHVVDCVRLNSDGQDDFIVDAGGLRYVPTGWATADGPLPFDQCGPALRPGNTWDYYDSFPGLDDPSRTFEVTIYHGDLVFTGLSVAP